MPHLNKFLGGFGIHKGMQLGDFILTHISGKHVEVSRFREYEYPIDLTFQAQKELSDTDDLYYKLKHLTDRSLIIYTRHGNPYECQFGTPYVKEVHNDKVVISTLGHATRV